MSKKDFYNNSEKDLVLYVLAKYNDFIRSTPLSQDPELAQWSRYLTKKKLDELVEQGLVIRSTAQRPQYKINYPKYIEYRKESLRTDLTELLKKHRIVTEVDNDSEISLAYVNHIIREEEKRMMEEIKGRRKMTQAE